MQNYYKIREIITILNPSDMVDAEEGRTIMKLCVCQEEET